MTIGYAFKVQKIYLKCNFVGIFIFLPQCGLYIACLNSVTTVTRGNQQNYRQRSCSRGFWSGSTRPLGRTKCLRFSEMLSFYAGKCAVLMSPAASLLVRITYSNTQWYLMKAMPVWLQLQLIQIKKYQSHCISHSLFTLISNDIAWPLLIKYKYSCYLSVFFMVLSSLPGSKLSLWIRGRVHTPGLASVLLSLGPRGLQARTDSSGHAVREE